MSKSQPQHQHNNNKNYLGQHQVRVTGTHTGKETLVQRKTMSSKDLRLSFLDGWLMNYLQMSLGTECHCLSFTVQPSAQHQAVQSLRGLAFMPPRAKAKAFFSTVTGHRAVRMEPCPRVPARRGRINLKFPGAEHCPNPPANLAV